MIQPTGSQQPFGQASNGRFTRHSFRARLVARVITLMQNQWVQQAAWLGDAPRPRWHSFDRAPWRHPWLTPENLARAKAHGRSVLSRAEEICGQADRRRLHFGFVGNIANNLYIRAVALRRFGLDITVFPVPDDNFVMSDPGWEEFDGTIPESVTTTSELTARGISLPCPQGIFRPAEACSRVTGSRSLFKLLRTTRITDVLRWPDYFLHHSTLSALQGTDAMLALQCPYLAYLSGKPYLVAQMGGDIWYECARDDGLGRLQRRSFALANAYLASNPWAYAHARRYGMRHLVYVPQIVDEEVYSPGASDCRRQWQEQTGGSFFVLSTARADDFFKGTQIALEGFVRFAREAPGARLLMLGWGKDLNAHLDAFKALGIADKVSVLPLSGKKKVIQYLRAADCLLDQFVIGYFGATALEAMGCGLPIIMRLEQAHYDALCETGAPPVFNASSPHQVHAALKLLASGNGARERAALAHREWLVANHSGKRWHREYEHLLTATALGHRFDFSRSPLVDPLGPDEVEYHREELANAPKFPNYF